MAIANGYASLPEIKERLLDAATYTAATIGFTASTKTIDDTAFGLKAFQTGDIIEISGSTSNDGLYNVATGDTPGTLITTETLVNESASATVTITNITVQKDDALLESIVEAISRWIDNHTGRRFYQTSETRYYTADFNDLLFVDDFTGTPTIKTDDDGDRTYENTWAATDYDALPLNGSVDGVPFTMLETTPNGTLTFPKIKKGVEIAASFGYSSTAPKAIKEACLLASERLARRKDAIFGVTGSRDLGSADVAIRIVKNDPDVMNLLAPYVRHVLGSVS